MLVINTLEPSGPFGANEPPLISNDVFSANGCIQTWPSIIPPLIVNVPLLTLIERYVGVEIVPPLIVVEIAPQPWWIAEYIWVTPEAEFCSLKFSITPFSTTSTPELAIV